MSTSQEIQAQIEQMEMSLEPLNIELDLLYSEFGSKLPLEVEKWMERSVRRKIESNAATVNSGGLEPLRLIRADLNALIHELPQICRDAFGERDQWPHRQTATSSVSSVSGYKESHAAASFRRAINHLGAFLEKHNLIAESADRIAEWERVAPGKYRYAINPGFDERNFPVLVEYNAKRLARTQQTAALEKKRQELAQAQARELWDEA